ncbi:hypothetical protein [uncultured Eudoraea sp.]|uniref:hypothetical protein n=1 Tax=uncultured Eudoraea sp. TaxID=1035614 RepID=UPI0026299705|nr:hypothetical protein [uncultured Eudoraea sp.]
MLKNYVVNIFKNIGIIGFFLLPYAILSQEPQIFTREDFDLRGDVKSCLVIADYGKEEFEFNREGLLTKNVTRYNEADYDITYYKYLEGQLLEKRDEIYREGQFDKQISIAHFYDVDTTNNKKISEKIISYTGDVLDIYEYNYNKAGNLIGIIRSNNKGLDETNIEYSSYKGESTITYLLNGVTLKSIRTSFKKNRKGIKNKIVLTKEFLEGLPNKALEEIYDSENKLISQKEFRYDESKQSFEAVKEVSYFYDATGMLSKEVSKVDKSVRSKEYIYQFDGEEAQNWVKQIIAPQNLFTTRSITYFQDELLKTEE